MKHIVKKLPESKIEIEIEVSSNELDSFFNKAVLNAGKDLEVEGFRKGKAPKEIIEKKIGKENILVDAADLAIKENYKKVILDNTIEPISQPEIDILKLAPGNPLIFKAVVSVLPEIELPDYRKIIEKIKRKEVSIEEKELEHALKWLQKSRAKFSLKNEPAQKGDFVEIEYWISQINDSYKKDAFILGEAHFIPGFEDKLIGMKAGEDKKEFSLDIPKDYSAKDLASKKLDFKVKLNSVQKVEFPEINDEFAKSLGEIDSLETLKKNIKQGLIMEKEHSETQRLRNEILEEISKNIDFEIPEILIKREQEAMMENFKREVSERLNISFKDYLDKVKKTEQEILNSFLAEAKKRVKSFLILRAIGEKERIEVSEQEIEQEITKTLKQHPGSEQAKKGLDFERLKEYSRGVIKNEKIFKLLESLTRH